MSHLSVSSYLSSALSDELREAVVADKLPHTRLDVETPETHSTVSVIRLSHLLCLSEETLKAGGPFYLVSMPGEVKDPTQGVNV